MQTGKFAAWTLVTALFLGLSGARAADGELDDGFAVGGKLELAFNFAEPKNDLAYDIVVDGDRSYVIGAASTNLGSVPVIVRLQHNGHLDNSYAQAGINVIDGLLGIYDAYEFRAAALQNDGKLVAVGTAEIGLNSDMLACRFDQSGALDATFGQEMGCTRIPFDLTPNGVDKAHDVLIKPNGRVIMAGVAYAANNAKRMAIAQLNTLGLPDQGFNGNGRVDLGYPTWTNAWASSLALDRQSKILVGGTIQQSESSACDADFAIVRLEASGTPDVTYGGSGRSRVPFDKGPTVQGCDYWHDELLGMYLVPDGSLFVGGKAQFSETGDSQIAVAKLDSSGMLDPSFGTFGRMSDYVCDVCGSSFPTKFIGRPDGKMFLTGATMIGGLYSQAFVVRLARNGEVNKQTYFGFDAPPQNDNATDFPFSISLQAGRPLIVGVTDYEDDNLDYNMTVVRLDDDYIFFSDLE